MAEVGSVKLLENDRVVVWEMSHETTNIGSDSYREILVELK